MRTQVVGDPQEDSGRAPEGPGACGLDEPAALDAELTGAKAAALATARAAGLPVLPGFAVTTAATAAVDRAGGDLGALPGDVRERWAALSDGGDRPLVVRSSSTAEDLGDSSMAGRFESVIGVTGWEAFVDAVATVLASRARAAEGDSGIDAGVPIAVLVQPLLEPAKGGVLFGVDPVTGRSDRMVVAAVTGGPEALVSGEVDGDRYELDLDGRVRSHVEGAGGAALSGAQLQALQALAERAGGTFGGPQDVEWAIDHDGQLWLLQSRPVTTDVVGVPRGPVLGPGPVAETFPDALSRLEQALWVDPLRRALRAVFELADLASEAELEQSPLVVCVDGHVAVDLELFGVVPRQASRWSAVDPRPRIRRLRGSWRLGRLRAALPDLADDILVATDADLAAVPDLHDLTDRQLLALLDRTAQALTAVHGHEVLLGLLLSDGAPRFTGASVALRVLAHARREGLDDLEIPVRHPVVLALVPPHVGPASALPDTGPAPEWSPPDSGDRAGLLREALRLRVRWLQELSGRAAWLLGERLAARGVLEDASAVRHLRLDALRAVVTDKAAVWQVAPARDGDTAPLPARFRLTAGGRPVAVTGASGDGGGSGAGGGRGRGPVWDGDGDVPDGAVLVVRTLDATIAPALPRLSGLVAETGSVLAHVAILAREAGVPTVVGVPDAVERFPAGTVVTVDGTSGEVAPIEEER